MKANLIAWAGAISLFVFALRCMKAPRVTVEQMRAALRGKQMAPGMRFQHDCDLCIPVAARGNYDLYIHVDDVGPSAVVRWDDDPDAYLMGADLGFLMHSDIEMGRLDLNRETYVKGQG